MSLLEAIKVKKQKAGEQRRRSTRAVASLIIIPLVCCSLQMKQIQFYKDVLAANLQRIVQENTNEGNREHDHHNSTNTSWSEETRHARPNHTYPFTIAACLLARDDNLLLPEWIAFHYTVLPLRHLIIAADPFSITSPEPILGAFREELPDLTIELWTGNSYWHDGQWSRERFENFDPHNHTWKQAYTMYLQRQRAFYTTCLRQLKQQGNFSWTVIIDTDEFFTYNALLPSEQSQSSPLRMSLPSSIGRQNETIAHWLARDKTVHKNTTICYVYPRVFFSAKDQLSTKEQADINTTVPSSFFPVKTFHTLRYRSHQPVGRRQPGKSLVNVHNYNGRDKVTNPHRPLGDTCDNSWSQKIELEKIPFRVHHYSGSLDTFVAGPRRSAQQWADRNDFPIAGKDHSLAGWFHNFVQLVGEKTAYKLTVETRQDAYLQWKDIKYRVEQKNETIPLAFEYDQPGGAEKGRNKRQ
ncbi:expressed unknown protein [Seminavis robusta]|uniref:Glycosyltransferase family 92 protein n=1 Tax=Seminavis robusta TaxID=568900 RepID=A0A9N8EM35_9STRA|nr:expressed unknown protein [Seminavis robusta]|eukprot:Sro1387_g268380.1 n/a (468) ;mRNA; r:18415-19818